VLNLFRTYSDYIATTDEWIGILKVACQYEFVEVKRFAIRGLEKLDLSVVQRLRIYQLYNVHFAHIVPLLVQLCLREEGPTDGETEELGIKTSLIIYRARERLCSHVPGGISVDEATRTICSIINVDPAGFKILGGSVMYRELYHLACTNSTFLFVFQLRRRGTMGPTREAYVYCDHLYHGPEDKWRIPGNVTSSFSSIYKRLIILFF